MYTLQPLLCYLATFYKIKVGGVQKELQYKLWLSSFLGKKKKELQFQGFITDQFWNIFDRTQKFSLPLKNNVNAWILKWDLSVEYPFKAFRILASIISTICLSFKTKAKKKVNSLENIFLKKSGRF